MSKLIIRLDALDWSIGGGHHHTGHLYFSDDRNRVEIERSLSLREAKLLRPDHSERAYDEPYFRVTNRFDTRDDLIRAATKWCEITIAGEWVLRLNDSDGLILGHNCLNPVRVRMLNLLMDCEDKAYVWRNGFGNMDEDRSMAYHRARQAWEVV